MTEKRKPTYGLGAIEAVFPSVADPKATGTALRDAATLGSGVHEIVKVIQSMERHHFHRSMTSYADHRVRQDVQYVPSEQRTLYVKFTVDAATDFQLLSFKE